MSLEAQPTIYIERKKAAKSVSVVPIAESAPVTAQVARVIAEKKNK